MFACTFDHKFNDIFQDYHPIRTSIFIAAADDDETFGTCTVRILFDNTCGVTAKSKADCARRVKDRWN